MVKNDHVRGVAIDRVDNRPLLPPTLMVQPQLPGRNRGRQACGASAHDEHVTHRHGAALRREARIDASERLVDDGERLAGARPP